MKNSIFRIEANAEIAPQMFEMVLQWAEDERGQEAMHEGVPACDPAGHDPADSSLAQRKPDFSAIRPGQFINIQLAGKFLRRPISICDWDEATGTLTIAYKVVGQGTAQMATMRAGECLDVLWPLGNGYDIDVLRREGLGTGKAVGEQRESSRPRRPLLIGGGAGVPPMVGLCRALVEASGIADRGTGNGMDPLDMLRAEQSIQPTVVLGFRTEADVYYREVFEKMGARVLIATEDGSKGTKGFVTDVLRQLLCGETTESRLEDMNEAAGGTPENTDAAAGLYAPFDSFYACGPQAMLQAVDQLLPSQIPGQLSFEERMGCGFGACMGCSCRTKYGSKRICKDGPVLDRTEIIWDEPEVRA